MARACSVNALGAMYAQLRGPHRLMDSFWLSALPNLSQMPSRWAQDTAARGDCWLCSNMIVIVMGVSGVGKTTIGRMLAVQLRFEFADGDDFHPPPNVHKMSRNIPLAETDRRPWLSRIVRKINQWRAERRDFALVPLSSTGTVQR